MTSLDSGAGFENPYGTDMEGEIPRLSGLAIAALVCSLILCIPGLPLIGVVLGLIALVTMVGHAHVRGRGMAIAAIVIGLIFSIMHGAATWWVVSKGVPFFSQMVTFMRDAPKQTMQAGLSGDVAAFQANFDGAGATLPAADAQAFLNEVSQRWGTLASQDLDQSTPMRPQPGQPMIDAPYIAKFSGGDVRTNVELIFMDPKSQQFINKIGAIEFVDVQRGNLRFPPLPKAPGGAPPVPPPASPPSTPPADAGGS